MHSPMKPAAIGIIFSQDRTAVLLIQRNDVPVWVLPGGGIEEGEAADKAAVREVFEETGLVVRIKREVAYYFPLNFLASETSLFECQIIAGSLKHPFCPNSEALNAAFFPLNALPRTLFPLHKEWIVDALDDSLKVQYKPIHSLTFAKICSLAIRYPLYALKYFLSRLGFGVK